MARHTPSPELNSTEEAIINVVEHSPTSATHYPDISPSIPEPVQDTKPRKRLSFWKDMIAKKPKGDTELNVSDLWSSVTLIMDDIVIFFFSLGMFAKPLMVKISCT
jgi:hypothetical protein